MNNKGFTLIELIVTIVILSIVMSIGAYSIINIINATNEENYESLIKNINSAVSSYALECKYANNSGITCNNPLKLGDLVTYGYLSGNGKNNQNNYTLVNPKDDKSIADCQIKYTDNNGKIVVTAVNPTGSCPQAY